MTIGVSHSSSLLIQSAAGLESLGHDMEDIEKNDRNERKKRKKRFKMQFWEKCVTKVMQLL